MLVSIFLAFRLSLDTDLLPFLFSSTLAFITVTLLIFIFFLLFYPFFFHIMTFASGKRTHGSHVMKQGEKTIPPKTIATLLIGLYLCSLYVVRGFTTYTLFNIYI